MKQTALHSRVIPPGTWTDPDAHWLTAMNHPWYRHMAIIQDAVVAAAHRFLRSQGLLHFAAPVTTGSISSPMGPGSDSLPVEVEMMGVSTHLADSMQFALEYGCRLAPRGVYYVMQCFRGEDADVSHLNQFCHIEFEIPGTLDTAVDLAWSLVQAIASETLEQAGDSVRALAGDDSHVRRLVALPQAPRLRFDRIAGSLGGADLMRVGAGEASALTRSGEASLSRMFGVADALWVTHMDRLSVPFYQAREDGTRQSLSADLLLDGREVVGLGQRHTHPDDVLAALLEQDVSAEPYAWYVRMKQERPLRTSGMGIGVERLIMWIVKSEDIRDIPLVSRVGLPQSAP